MAAVSPKPCWNTGDTAVVTARELSAVQMVNGALDADRAQVEAWKEDSRTTGYTA